MSYILIGEVELGRTRYHEEVQRVVNYVKRGYVEINASTPGHAKEIASKDFPFLQKIRIFREIE